MNGNANARAALLMMFAMAAFTTNDVITKWLTSSMGVGQTMFLRGVLATGILAALAWRQGVFSKAHELLRPAVLTRSVFEVLGTVTFLASLPHLPISSISAIYQALPLVVTLGAALILGEQVGWRRWTAIGVGFAGVMLIVRPGMDGFNAWSMVVVLSVLFSAIRDLATRRLPPGISTFAIALLASIGVTATGGAMIPFEGGFQPVEPSMVAGLFCAAVLLVAAYSALIAAMRTGEISFIAPFRYVSLVVALVLGYIAFNEVPDTLMLVGGAIVVASGIYALYRERIRAAEAAAKAAGQ